MALAAGVSEYYGNRWYVAALIYWLAVLDGFGLMRNHAHCFSDLIGAALLGAGATELFFGAQAPSNRIEPVVDLSMSAPSVPMAGSRPSIGLGAAYSW